LIAEIDSRRWLRIAVTGCVQGGKSYMGYVAPCLYHIFEHGESVVLGCPSMDIARNKWNNEILPAIQAIPRFRDQLPDVGAGSRGGMAEEIAFKHGPKLKFMPAGGGDAKRSSYTARVLVATEIDKYDTAGQASREAPPIVQMEARLLSYDESERQVYVECTVSIETGAIWQEIKAGTDSRIVVPCPACREWVTPEREHLVGWQDAPTKKAARRAARWNCPACGAEWIDKVRREINQRCRLVHRGQSIDAAGTVTGEVPETDTLGFRWNAFHNLFWSTAAIASAEWTAARAPDEDAAEKEMRQFYWTIPWAPPDFDQTPLDVAAVRRRFAHYPKGLVPDDAAYLTLGLDPGKRVSWWLVVAWWPDGRGHIVDYGTIEVPSDSLGLERALIAALRDFRDRVYTGWATPGGQPKIPDQVWIDSKFQRNVVYEFIRETKDHRFRPAMGFGTGQQHAQWYNRPKKTGAIVKFIGEDYHICWMKKDRVFLIECNADHWKSWAHRRLSVPLAEPGAVTLYHGSNNEHTTLVKHFDAEEEKTEFIPGKGTVRKWVRKSRANHWLDCFYNACAAGHLAGVRLIAAPQPPPQPQPRPSQGRGEPYLDLGDEPWLPLRD